MMNNNTVYIVLRTMSLYSPEQGRWRVVPVIDGVFSSYDAANDFVEPLLDDKPDFVEYSIISDTVR